MNVSQSGIDLIKSFERCRLTAYPDQGGVWTCGWGATGPDVVEGTVWTQQVADNRLASDLTRFEDCVNNNVTVTLAQNQFDALVDFSYNVGETAFEDSTLLELLNQSQFDACPAQFMRWVHVRGVLSPGLERRRMAEVAMFKGAV
jgi:lysozyme